MGNGTQEDEEEEEDTNQITQTRRDERTPSLGKPNNLLVLSIYLYKQVN
jgi:hypothetical protein